MAQDAVQDAMLSAVRSLSRFRGDSQMSTWLGRIVVNSALSRRRVMRRRPEHSLDTLFEQPGIGGGGDGSREPYGAPIAAAGPGPERALLHNEIRGILRDTIDELPRDYRTVVRMRYFEDARIAEIAAKLDITPNAAKLRLLRAHRALRGLLAQRGYERM